MVLLQIYEYEIWFMFILDMHLAYRWQATIIVALGAFMATLDTTIVSVALPQMQRTLRTDFTTITWVATGYFLAQAAVTPIVGYLSDRFGTRDVLLAALLVFTLGSALCAAASTTVLLVVFRMLQGLGAGE